MGAFSGSPTALMHYAPIVAHGRAAMIPRFRPFTPRLDGNDARAHQVLAEDIRAATGMQDFVGTAPLNLVYVADLARMRRMVKNFI